MAREAPLQSDGPHATGWAARALPRLETVVPVRSGWLLLGLVAAAFGGTARAESVSANLQVSAQVLPHADLQLDAAPVSITAADVQRGYLDVSRHYRLNTNAPDRVSLQLNPRVGLTDSIDIQGFQAPVRMGELEVEVSQPFRRQFTLTYRLWLIAGATPGEYELPVQLNAIVR